MEYGSKVDFFEDIAEKRGSFDTTPLATRPEITPEIAFYLEAFEILSSSRSVGMSLGNIPVSEIILYGTTFPIIDDLFTFVQVIARVDGLYLSHLNKKNKPKNK
jgi:hypothetical protein